jgi:bifunctional non-homologous end joining protein LigD
VKVDSRVIELSNRSKVMFPDDGLTKGDLIDYYRRMACRMIPHLAERPVMLQRFPDGIAAEGFYQRQAPDYFPDWIERVEIGLKGQDRDQSMVICQDAATLVYLSSQACITPHPWLSRRAALDRPDRMIFDLDPSTDDFAGACDAARRLRDILERVGLRSYVMTTGSKGLHVTVPLRPEASFDSVRGFARDVVAFLADRHPDRYTTESRREKRGNRLFLDYLRNSYAQTAVVPYAVRARAGAPVATPLDWEELGDSCVRPDQYTIGNIFRRLGHKEDPWSRLPRQARSLRRVRESLADMIGDRSG